MIVGVIGGGQLARMLALAGQPLGIRCLFLDPAPDACARTVGELLCGDYGDERLLDELASRAAVVTYEFENVPEASLRYLASRVSVHPRPRALALARDRWHEKRLFADLSIPTPSFAAIDTRADLEQALAVVGRPAVLKTRTMGYDGKGQRVIREARDADDAFSALCGTPLILEGFVAFEREVSLIAVRNTAGTIHFYPLTENIHRNGILVQSLARPGDPMTPCAEAHVQSILMHLDYVGVLAVEFFQKGDTLLANEMAPRVHNSGHWTIEGAETSQFENHLRAVLDLPLGATRTVAPSGMVNFVGHLPEASAVLAVPGAHLHVYGKAPRPGRKLGHATARAPKERDVLEALRRLRALADAGPPN
ncbi:5-(carboxyamino)imidazole ribonucleotide synthase [Acidiferrobacter sp.]|uniref:5-(carboxyamino)imidazole ribonucleotide synthase n=1 Tax=Acidiferrobacter sp. TaxID=1872107 RepID=UPI002608FF47|nr:5-(carboxyamino)imidazole ribonucleotide synthase [Acidiferrobacter sp.]